MKIVYVLTNPAMPELVKIGHTSQEGANNRIGKLYSTGVPVPFKLEFACRVKNAEEVEKALHIAFGPHRINPQREFFKIDVAQAIAILRLLHQEEATQEVALQPDGLDEQSKKAAAQLQNRRPNLNFYEMGIPSGSILNSIHSNANAKVIGPKRVLFAGEETSLTAATRQVLRLEYSVAPGPHWRFESRLLRDIYNETYQYSD